MVNELKETDINQLKSQVKQLQEGELLKKDQGILLEEVTNQEKHS